MAVQVLILAGGQGKRMFSETPKVLHKIAGLPIIEHIIRVAEKLTTTSPIIIYGHKGAIVKTSLQNYKITWVEQLEQLGTGHAVLQALPVIQDDDHILILYSDTPLLSQATLSKLIESPAPDIIKLLTARVEKPHGYGRIIRDEDDEIVNIIEEKDATEIEREIKEINAGVYFIPGSLLKKYLPLVENKNAQNEYYLTDVIMLALQDGMKIESVQPAAYQEILGINDKQQLASLERYYQLRQAEVLMQQGVTLLDPARLDIRGEVAIGSDVIIDVNVIFEGRVIIGNGCTISANTIIRNSTISDNVIIKENCVIEDALIGNECIIGPFARIRPGTHLAAKVHIGNFVEVKNSHIHEETKVNHLTYIGDSEIGMKVNIGAGTITCNYDGVKKHKTIIEDFVSIGANSSLVAPVTIGTGGIVGAGSTITQDTPPNELTIARSRQVSKKYKKITTKK